MSKVMDNISLEVPTYIALHKLIANDFLKMQYNFYNGYDYFNLLPPSSSWEHSVKSKNDHISDRRGKSYKDICRMVNTNGFTNPGGVPVCPY
uniref:Uncharacterized protein n=1 Tax=Glossina palpalis gambiensis TaxID=67801 RepID=A0A1B0BRF0_9MUSC